MTKASSAVKGDYPILNSTPSIASYKYPAPPPTAPKSTKGHVSLRHSRANLSTGGQPKTLAPEDSDSLKIQKSKDLKSIVDLYRGQIRSFNSRYSKMLKVEDQLIQS